MQVRGVDFVVYNVSDMEQALTFYRDALGLPVESNYQDTWVEFEVGGVTLALCGPQWGSPVEPDYQGGATLGLAVDDVRKAVESLRGKGFTAADADETSVCYIATVEDPFGNRLLLHQRKDGTWG